MGVEGRRNTAYAFESYEASLAGVQYYEGGKAAKSKRKFIEADNEINRTLLALEEADLDESYENKAALLAERAKQREASISLAYASQGVDIDSGAALKASEYEKKVAQDDLNELRNQALAQKFGMQLQRVNLSHGDRMARINEKLEKSAAKMRLVGNLLSSGSKAAAAGAGG